MRRGSSDGSPPAECRRRLAPLSGAAVAGPVLTALACQTLLDSTTPTPRPEVEAALEAFAGPAEVDEAFDGIDDWIDRAPEEVEAAALTRLGSPAFGLRFAAAYALTHTAETEEGVAALRGLLEAESVSLQMLAAEGLLVRGHPFGLPLLIEALDLPDPLAYSDPPALAWQYAGELFLLYTEQDFGLREAETLEAARAVQPAWEAW